MFLKEAPNLSNKDIVAKMSEEWRNLDAKGKEPYDKLAKAEKERYEREKKEYDPKKGKKVNKGKESAKKSAIKEDGKISSKKTPNK